MFTSKNFVSLFVLFMTILFMVVSNGVDASPIDILGKFSVSNVPIPSSPLIFTETICLHPFSLRDLRRAPRVP